MTVSDAARERAEELGVDVDEVDGTGSGGNVTVKDVERHAGGGADPAPTTDEGTVDRAAIDKLDAGAPMLPGSPSEPQGPEDALGEGEKRGDYSSRQPEGTEHFEARPIPGGGGLIENEDGGVDRAPHSELVRQNDRVEDVGEVAGQKGGVETA